jgi:hypothetical protein
MPTYKILTLGDSVMWGQGLLQQHKFSQLVADRLAGSGKTVELAALPHSGAVACLGPTPPGAFDSFLYGELPRSFPSISSQVAIAGQVPGYAPFLAPSSFDPADWRAAKLSLQRAIAGYSGPGGQPPDLILVDGGINDLGALQIAIPWNLHSPDPCAGAVPAPGATVARVIDQLDAAGGDASALDLASFQWITDQELEQLIDRYVYDRMRSLVGRLAQAFPGARVVVTGYFPIFTTGSLAELAAHPAAAVLVAHRAGEHEMRAALSLALHQEAGGPAFANRVVEQSTLWYRYGTTRLKDVVDEANGLYGNRFALASPAFGPDNGALAPDAWLWSFPELIDDLIQKILALFGTGAAGAPAVAAAAPGLPGTAAGARSIFGDWGPAFAFLAGLGLGRQIATDEVIPVRAAAAYDYYFLSPTGRADPETNLETGLKAGFASIGHPNVQGALAYLAAIAPWLP